MELLSKRELLAMTHISYGQLYRWKRERLIPEDWFIKQSSYTGQETFFPKDRILERISAILMMKDEHSLEELSKIFAPEISSMVSLEVLRQAVAFGPEQWDIIQKHYGNGDYRLMEAAFLALIHETTNRVALSPEQLESLLQRSMSVLAQQKHLDTNCTIFTVNGTCHAAFSKDDALTFDDGVNVVASKPLSEAASELQMNHNSLQGDKIKKEQK